MPGRASTLCEYGFGVCGDWVDFLTILRIVHNHTSTTSVGKLNLQSSLQTIGFRANLIAIRLKAAEELADVVVSLIFFVGELWIRPDLNEVSYEIAFSCLFLSRMPCD
jgi:hypothetical protein